MQMNNLLLSMYHYISKSMTERKKLKIDKYEGVRQSAKERRGKALVNPAYHALLEPLVEHPDNIPDLVNPGSSNTKLLNDGIREGIIRLIEAGNFPGVAAKACGISYHTLRNWLKWGREGKNRLYYDFWCEVVEAEAVAEANLVKTVKRHATHDWRAAVELLGRRYPDNWGKRDVSAHVHKIEGEITIKEREEFAGKIIDDNEVRESARKLLEQGSTS